MDVLTFANNGWIDDDAPVVRVRDHALWMASTVFDGIRAFENVIPDVDRHCERLIASAQVMGLAPTLNAIDIEILVREGVGRFPRDTALYIRPMFWASEGWAVPIAESTQFGLVVQRAPLPSSEGFSACLSPVRRPSPDTAPTEAKAACLYPATARALRTARAAGFENAIVLDPFGNVAEFATANLFYVTGGQVFTPQPNGTFLDGITRQRVISLLRRDGKVVVETTVQFEQVEHADEVFSTGNFGKVQPLRRLGNRKFDIGPVTRRARQLYRDYALESAGLSSALLTAL
ncbi:branched-chain amino acid aminotransferase [uncultured Bradyrhizobium sp.]|uniref:branched-chain amino acid aminotransferase n=1 Tax=uncultured Bradyrhizobium sp. TaxID=199684 RepID=UPI0035CC09A3